MHWASIVCDRVTAVNRGDKGMAEMTLKDGTVILVDEEDVPIVLAHKWRSVGGDPGRRYIGYSTRGETPQRLVYLHRLLMNAPEDMVVDHINRNKLDNRRSNLQIITLAENTRRSGPRGNGTSRFKGVCWDTRNQRWRATISADGRYWNLGLCKDEETAARRYDAKARELFGQHAGTNFPEEV